MEENIMIRYKVELIKYNLIKYNLIKYNRSINKVISPIEDFCNVPSKKTAYYRIEKTRKDVGGINYRTDTSEGD
jgi:hypothetical protein